MTSISFCSLIKQIIKKTFTLSGREPKESILAYLCFFFLSESALFILYHFIDLKLGYQIIFSFCPLLPLPALFIRRLHDHNKNMGFTLLPFLLFLLLLPFLNFKVFTSHPTNEKIISGGILIEIIAVLFLIQFFLFCIFLFLEGNKNENLYGEPVQYLLAFSKKGAVLFFCFFSLCLFSLIHPLKQENQPIFLNSKEISTSTTPKKIASFTSLPAKKMIFNKIKFHEAKEITQTAPKRKKEKIKEFPSLEQEIKINDILNFFFSLSFQSLKEEKEISYSSQTPSEIILIKATKGDILFILKDLSLLPLLKKQHIDCQKEICVFRSFEYLKTIEKES